MWICNKLLEKIRLKINSAKARQSINLLSAPFFSLIFSFFLFFFLNNTSKKEPHVQLTERADKFIRD